MKLEFKMMRQALEFSRSQKKKKNVEFDVVNRQLESTAVHFLFASHAHGSSVIKNTYYTHTHTHKN